MLADLLRDHDGVITLAQAKQAGLSPDDLDYRVRTGRWRRCARGVYFADDRQYTDSARIRVGVWAYGDQAVASGLTAAWWQHLTQYAPGVVEVTVPRDRRLRFHPGTKLRRRDLDPADVVQRDHLRVTALPLTVIEAAARRGGGAKLILETGGWAFHSDADDFHHDRVRQNALILADWQVLRFTWLDLTEYPDRVIAQINRALNR